MNNFSARTDVMVHHLQSAAWPRGSAIATDEELCFRAYPRECWRFDPDAGLSALPLLGNVRQMIDLSTFFGAFSLTTWCSAAGLDEIVIEARFKGTCTLKFFEDNGYEGRLLIWERHVTSDGLQPYRVTLPDMKGRRGILFPLFEVLRDVPFELFTVDYYTTTAPRHAPKLAVVMPTFKRENYARANVELICREVLPMLGDRARLFVVDNGNTLKLPELSGVELITNRNFGGAGGFARGMLEACASSHGFSHVLFCDDDVRIDAQSIIRLMNLLGYLSQDRIVSGGMLKMGMRNVLHEKNANVTNMRFSSNRGNDNLLTYDAVARYDETSFATFCGWWFVCYPVASHKDSFLPFPFFVGWDDVEMGRRCNGMDLKVVTLLGVGVWHEEFEKKDVNWRWFYHTRNGLAVSMIYDPDARAMRQAILEIMTALLTYRYERAEFMIDGLAAVTTGTRSIRDNAADELHTKLTAQQQSKFIDVGYSVIPERIHRKPPASKLRSFFAKVTMNGHLLPHVFFKRALDPADPGWAVQPLHSNQLNTIYRCPKVVYYEPISGKGIECAIDRPRFFKLLFRLLGRWIKLRLRWGSVARQWRSEHRQMTSPDFWTRYLGLQK